MINVIADETHLHAVRHDVFVLLQFLFRSIEKSKSNSCAVCRHVIIASAIACVCVSCVTWFQFQSIACCVREIEVHREFVIARISSEVVARLYIRNLSL